MGNSNCRQSVDQWFLELAEQEIPGSAEIQTQPDCSGATFFLARTIDQLIAEQSVLPVSDLGALAGAIPDGDIDEFVADIYRARELGDWNDPVVASLRTIYG